MRRREWTSSADRPASSIGYVLVPVSTCLHPSLASVDSHILCYPQYSYLHTCTHVYNHWPLSVNLELSSPVRLPSGLSKNTSVRRSLNASLNEMPRVTAPHPASPQRPAMQMTPCAQIALTPCDTGNEVSHHCCSSYGCPCLWCSIDLVGTSVLAVGLVKSSEFKFCSLHVEAFQDTQTLSCNAPWIL